MAQTKRKALGSALLQKAGSFGELSANTASSIQTSGIIQLSGRVLTHRTVLDSQTSSIVNLLDSNTARVLGVTDFDKLRPARTGFYGITHISVATTGVLDGKDDNTIAVANFVKAMKAEDAFLQNAEITISVKQSKQPDLKFRLGDVMSSANPERPSDSLFELPEGYYFTKESEIDFQIEFPRGANGIEAGKYKGLEINLHAMYADI